MTADNWTAGRSPADPRATLFLTLAFAILLLFTSSTVAIALEFAAVAALVLWLGQVHAWLDLLKVLVPMLLFFLIVMLLSLEPSAAVGGAIRLAAMTTGFFVFFRTTAPHDLANALVKMGAPYTFAFILTTALEFIPVLTWKMQDIMDAQRARGIRLERDFASIRNYPALFGPLLIQSFTLADRLAEAMEARGFGAPHRTFARQYAFRRRDWGILAFGMVLLLTAWELR